VAPEASDRADASARVDAFIAGLDGWQRTTVERLRWLVHDADADLVETFKWGVPVFALRGNVVAIGVFKNGVKVNVFKGASIADPRRLLNAGLEAKTSRAIDLREGDELEPEAFKALVRAAVAANR
jgi:hypothetical protein